MKHLIFLLLILAGSYAFSHNLLNQAYSGYSDGEHKDYYSNGNQAG